MLLGCVQKKMEERAAGLRTSDSYIFLDEEQSCRSRPNCEKKKTESKRRVLGPKVRHFSKKKP